MPAASPRVLVPAVVLILLAGVGGAYALLLLAVRDTEVERTSRRGVDTLVVTAHSDDIELTAAPAGAPVEVTRHVRKSFESPDRRESFSGGRLKLDYSCDGWPLDVCGIDYEISVPPGTRVVAGSGSGEVVAVGIRSRRGLELSSGSGDVTADTVSAARLELESGSGGVVATGVSARLLAAHAGSGDVVIDLGQPPNLLRVDAGSGDVILTVPDVAYELRASTPGGGLFNSGLRVDSPSTHRIDIDAGSGEVRLAPAE